MTQLIAVYGTLKQGGSNQRILDADNGKFIGKGETVQKFTMFGGYGFPRVIYDGPETSPIQCEVYEMDGLDNMDRLEGHPNFFCRREVEVNVGDAFTTVAWMYFHPHIDANEHAEYIQSDGYWEARRDYR
jgi:gamma-glutamylcyclotransferase (GGCT)/AIG2-like uncharacterized protein YtfP